MNFDEAMAFLAGLAVALGFFAILFLRSQRMRAQNMRDQNALVQTGVEASQSHWQGGTGVGVGAVPGTGVFSAGSGGNLSKVNYEKVNASFPLLLKQDVVHLEHEIALLRARINDHETMHLALEQQEQAAQDEVNLLEGGQGEGQGLQGQSSQGQGGVGIGVGNGKFGAGGEVLEGEKQQALLGYSSHSIKARESKNEVARLTALAVELSKMQDRLAELEKTFEEKS